MARRRIKEIEYGSADVKLAYQKLVRQAKRGERKFTDSYVQFESRVRNWLSPTTNLKQALRRELNSTRITSEGIRGPMNMLATIREKFPDVYRRINQLIGEVRKNGKFASLSTELTWNSALDAYTFVDKFDNTWIIDVTNSPADIDIKMI